MTLSSLLVTGAALAFVLGLLVMLAWLTRRVLPRVGSTNSAGRIEVLGRAGLAPKQGVATVRVEGRTVLVSYGEGGVRLLTELGVAREEDSTVEAAPPDPRADEGRRGTAGALRALTLGLVLSVIVPAPALHAQQRSSTHPTVTAPVQPHVTAPETPAVPKAGGASLPEMHLSVGSGKADDLKLDGPVGTVLFIGLLTLLPTLLLLMTSFTRILVVLHLLKQALGTQTAPPAHLLAAMALILTGFVMAPTLEKANDQALAPWMDGKIDTGQMMKAAAVPFRAFMLHSTRQKDLARFVQMSHRPAPETVDEIPFVTVTAAFVTSELTRAFQIGFALFLPFLIIDLVVASVLMSMGMFMLPPVMVSLPFKLLLFVLVDGWSLVLGSLVQSFH